MPENLQPESMSSWMRDVERRLAAVERPSRLSIVDYTTVSQPNVSVNVTSGTYAVVWEFSISSVVADSVSLAAVVITDPSTTANLRLVANTAGIPVTDVATVAANSQKIVRFDWLVPSMNIGSSGVLIQLEARRASGVGNVAVFQPLVAMQIPAFIWNAEADGNPQVS